MRGIVRGAAERSRLLEAYRASGMSAKGFAAREGIAASTLYQWLGEAKADSEEKATRAIPRMARVIRRRAAETSTETKPRGSALMLEVGAARVHVAAGFDAGTLATLLDLLEARGHATRS